MRIRFCGRMPAASARRCEPRPGIGEFCPVHAPRPAYRRGMTAEPYIAEDGDEPDQAEIEAAVAEYREWVFAGCPGELSHDEAMAELLTQ
jgi:hypothetical protein